MTRSAIKGASIIGKLLFSSPKSTHPHLTSPIRNLRSGAGWSDGDDEASHHQSSRRRDRDRDRGTNTDTFPPNPIPNRPLRGERGEKPPNRDTRPPRPPFKGLRNHNEGRPIRGDGQSNNTHLFSDLENEPSPFKSISGEDDQAGQSFLEKFKLGFDGKETQNQNQNQSLQENAAPEVAQTTQTQETSAPQVPQNSDEIFKKMKETGLIPNAVAMLDGLCKDGLVQEAMKLFGLMREKGTIPEVVIYTAVVEGFCKAHKFDEAKRIFRKMQNNGISPNAFSYNVLIGGLCKGKCLDDAIEFSVEMLEAGHSPNVGTFTTLIDCFCKDKGVEEAESTVKRLREKGFFVNDKAVREHLDKKGPFSPLVWKAIFGEKSSQRLF